MCRRFAPLFLLLFVLPLAGCEKEGPVEVDELARVVSRLEKGAGAREAAEKRLSLSSPYVTWKMLLPLIENKSAAPEARAAAIRAVVRTRQDLGLPGAIARTMADPDVTVRSEAIRAIVERADPDYSRPLREFAEATQNPDVKRDLEAALVALKARERQWHISQMTEATSPEDRALAARSLSEIGQEPDVPALIAAAVTPKNAGERLFQQEVILALSKIGGADAKVYVRDQLASQDAFMRGIAAFAETRLKDPEAVPALEGLLAAEMVADTRVSAATALGLIATEEAKAALAKSCSAGYPDKRVDLACVDARKEISKKL